MLCQRVSPDVVPLIAGGDQFIDALERSLLYFLRDGAVDHILGHSPFGFEKFNRACILFENLFSKLIVSLDIFPFIWIILIILIHESE